MPKAPRAKRTAAASIINGGQSSGGMGRGPGLPRRESDEKKHKQLTYQRRSVACQYCRKRKIRCYEDPQEPTDRCVACVKQNKNCIYTPVEHDTTPSSTTVVSGAPVTVEQASQEIATTTTPVVEVGTRLGGTPLLHQDNVSHEQNGHLPIMNGQHSPPGQYLRSDPYASFPPPTMHSHLHNAYSYGIENPMHQAYPNMTASVGSAPMFSGHHEHFGGGYPSSLPLTQPLPAYPNVGVESMHQTAYTYSPNDTRWHGSLSRAQTFADPESSRRTYSPAHYFNADATTRRSSTMSVIPRPPSSSYDRGSSAATSSRSPHLPTTMAEVNQLMYQNHSSASWNPYMEQDPQPRQGPHPDDLNHDYSEQPWYG